MDIILSPFIRWHILLSKVVKVAAADSTPAAKQHSQFVCDGHIDASQINKALEQLDYQYGNWEWYELRRRREWRWPWQPKVKTTRLGEGGTFILPESNFDITQTKKER